jgi:hypothetical protein
MNQPVSAMIDYETLYREQLTINDNLLSKVASLEAQVEAHKADKKRAAALLEQSANPFDTACLILRGETEEVSDAKG